MGLNQHLALFDLIAGLILLISALVGLARGATREITTLIAFALAIAVAVAGLPYVTPIMRQAIPYDWMATTAAALVLFIVAYVVFRLIGGALGRRVKESPGLSGLDRLLGLLIGAVRGLVVIGAFALLLDAVTPQPRPDWLAKARLYPVASAVGQALRAFAPKGLKAGREAATSARQWPRAADRGYSRSDRKSLDVVVEKSR